MRRVLALMVFGVISTSAVLAVPPGSADAARPACFRHTITDHKICTWVAPSGVRQFWDWGSGTIIEHRMHLGMLRNAD